MHLPLAPFWRLPTLLLSFPRTPHVVAHTIGNSQFRGSDTLQDSRALGMEMVNIHTCRLNTHMLINILDTLVSHMLVGG